ncbi:MAG TPA: ribonuclease III [Clostridia bacterium]|nr:ribonuclease III [Clostridia bacterium]
MQNKRNEAWRQLLSKLPLSKKPDLGLIEQALTHPSAVYEHLPGQKIHNQRLEFLGDAVIGLVIAEYLYQHYPQKSEGELTKMRAAIVCEAALVQSAQALELGKYLLLGKGEKLTGGAERVSNLVDAFEALLGALYLSLGLKEVSKLILLVLQKQIQEALQGEWGDFKTELQEYIQQNPDSSLHYQILRESGPDHAKQFLAAVFLNGQKLAEGQGRTKKEAEQQAAKEALKDLRG